eukprot:CAMPEP_0170540818 /NCGR_PEP_ID=MMETSP0211-20121228/752_1 /TAXON_ID=311385 /ORGANISM="Pseudokeronopsis sp., Strain OXSARD2" /LENGTH=64 /DNA_ID=CAMNT_0010843359 /DNA_START=181 /DNA_END=375 /DNA_ORIENTATION=-
MEKLSYEYSNNPDRHPYLNQKEREKRVKKIADMKTNGETLINEVKLSMNTGTSINKVDLEQPLI